MPAHFKLGTVPFSVPTSWDEVTVDQFFKLSKCDPKDYIAIVAVLSGLSYKKIELCKELDIDLQLAPHIEWTKEVIAWDKLNPPREVVFNLKVIKVSTDLELESFGQKVVYEQMLKEFITNAKGDTEDKRTADMAQIIPYGFSVYFCSKYYGKDFSKALVNTFMSTVMDLPIMTVYPIGAFFLRKYSGYGNLMRKDLKLKSILTKFRPALKNLIPSVFSKRSTPLRTATH